MLSAHHDVEAAIPAANQKNRILVVSVDYDGCFSGPRFNQARQSIQHLKESNPLAYTEAYRRIIADIHKSLVADIIKKSHGCTSIQIMIGSNRQTLEIDARNNNNNNNGSCFEGMTMLTECLQSLVGVPVTSDLRVCGDALMEKPNGHHADVYFNRAEMGEVTPESAARVETLRTLIRDHKYCLSFLQATNVCLENPDSEIVYQFYDDLAGILEESQQQFQQGQVAQYLPSNLSSVIFSRYQDSIVLTEVANLVEKIRKLAGQNIHADASSDEVALVLQIAKVCANLVKDFNGYLSNAELRAALADISSKLRKVDGFLEKVKNRVKEVRNEIHGELSQHATLVDLARQLSDITKANCEYVDGKESSGYVEDLNLAIARNDNPVLFKILLDPNLMHHIRLSQPNDNFASIHAEFKKQYIKLKNDAEAGVLKINEDLGRVEAEKSTYDNILRFLQPMPYETIAGIELLARDIESSLQEGAPAISMNALGEGIASLGRVINLFDSKSQPRIMQPGSEQHKSAVELGYGKTLEQIQVICDRHKQPLYLSDDKMLVAGQEIVVNPVTSRPRITASPDATAKVVMACTAQSVWQGANNQPVLPSLKVLHECTNTAVVLAKFAQCGRNKANFLVTLGALLADKDCNRATILSYFHEFKKLGGDLAFIHENKNKKWDAIRFKFKSNRNSGQGENTFWHTSTFSDAVKMLKDAYVARQGDVSASVEAGDLLINYHRGNKIAMPAQTATRKKGIN
jgi:hypothetical protein